MLDRSSFSVRRRLRTLNVNRSIKPQQPARDLAVEEVPRLQLLHAELAGEERVAGEDEERPAGAAFAEDLADRAVEPAQVFLFADAFAVGRVADQDAGGTRRRLEVGDVARREPQQMTNAGGAGVRLRETQGIRADVEAEDRV